MIKTCATLFLCLIIRVCFSQEPLGEALLPSPKQEGFHSIVLPPQVVGLMNVHKTNLRIYNSQQQETPYLYQEENPVHYSQHYLPYQILSKVMKKKCCSTFLLKNHQQHPINNFLLTLKNTALTKRGSLYGSDDQLQWFGLKENFLIYPEANQKSTTQMNVVEFPLSNYTYYKLILDDSTSAPIQILDIGHFEVVSTAGLYQPLEIDSLSVETVDKETHVYVHFNSPQEIDRLAITMEGAPYFLRRATLSKLVSSIHKGDSVVQQHPITYFEISSRQPAFLELDHTDQAHGTDFKITMYNDNNPPLIVKSIEAYQRKRFLTAWLSENETYTLRVESPTTPAPQYDLLYFKDSIPTQLTSLVPLEFQLFQKPTEVLTPTIFTTKNFIWATIIIVGLLLSYTAIRIAREVGSKTE